jgi:hypothetical protein
MVIASRVKQSSGKQGIASLGAQFFSVLSVFNALFVFFLFIAFLSSIDYTCYIRGHTFSLL